MTSSSIIRTIIRNFLYSIGVVTRLALIALTCAITALTLQGELLLAVGGGVVLGMSVVLLFQGYMLTVSRLMNGHLLVHLNEAVSSGGVISDCGDVPHV